MEKTRRRQRPVADLGTPELRRHKEKTRPPSEADSLKKKDWEAISFYCKIRKSALYFFKAPRPHASSLKNLVQARTSRISPPSEEDLLSKDLWAWTALRKSASDFHHWLWALGGQGPWPKEYLEQGNIPNSLKEHLEKILKIKKKWMKL